MSRTLSSNNATESQNTIVREHFLVLLDFSTPVRLSSRETITFESNSYTGASMELELSLDGAGGRLTFFDESFNVVSSFVSEGSDGVACRVFALYGDPTFSASDDDEIFNGELGAWAQADDVITVNLETPEEKWLPDIVINAENGFNHLPKPGTRIQTADGVVILGGV